MYRGLPDTFTHLRLFCVNGIDSHDVVAGAEPCYSHTAVRADAQSYGMVRAVMSLACSRIEGGLQSVNRCA